MGPESKSRVKVRRIASVFRPAKSGGVVWPGEIHVLARFGAKELWKVPGASISRGTAVRPEYVPAYMCLVSEADRVWRGDYVPGGETVLAEGGRFGRPKFAAHAEAIDAFFGVKLAHRIRARKTLIVEDATCSPGTPRTA